MRPILFLLGILLPFSLVHAQPRVGVATYFDGLGAPYGGCGVPQDKLETSNFVALNVFDTPGSGTNYPRPVTGAALEVIGEFQNGNNCGRWIKVTILENCNGINDGALGQPFCRGANAAWTTDSFVGATLNMIVADACADPNGWCRDSRYHLDLAKSSLTQFEKDGEKSTNMHPAYWNNRKVQWEYIQAPDYEGDINIHFMQGAQQYWTPILITHLPNGIHGIEQKVGNQWLPAERYVDMGQAFILPNNASPLRIRIIDANDRLLNQGREYIFSYPAAACGQKCTLPTTEVAYQTSEVVTAVAGLHESSEQPSIWWMAPRPAIGWQGALEPETEIQVIDMLGNIVQAAPISSTKGSHEAAQLAKGFYQVVLTTQGRTLAKTAMVVY